MDIKFKKNSKEANEAKNFNKAFFLFNITVLIWIVHTKYQKCIIIFQRPNYSSSKHESHKNFI